MCCSVHCRQLIEAGAQQRRESWTWKLKITHSYDASSSVSDAGATAKYIVELARYVSPTRRVSQNGRVEIDFVLSKNRVRRSQLSDDVSFFLGSFPHRPNHIWIWIIRVRIGSPIINYKRGRQFRFYGISGRFKLLSAVFLPSLYFYSGNYFKFSV